MTEHTPTPWRHKAIKGGWDGVEAEDGTEICTLSYNNPANADHIVLAVNNFEALLSALRIAEEELEFDENHAVVAKTGERRKVDDALKLIRAVLLKFTPEKPKATLLPPSSQSTGDE